MTVGEMLTEARYHAGLSVEELSERTRIRGTVIRSIEQDDFEACGGDLYVRGYVRAIAGAVGIDAQPLIREFDLGRSGRSNERANGSADRYSTGYPSAASLETAGYPAAAPLETAGHPSIAPPGTAQTSFDLPAVKGQPPAPEAPPAPESPAPEAPAQEAPASPAAADLNATRYDMPAVAAAPAATSYDLPRLPDNVSAAADFSLAALPTAEFPQASTVPAPIPPAAVPPGTADTRYDIPAVRDGIFFPAPPVDLGPVGASAGTQIIPAAGFEGVPPEPTTSWLVSEEGGPGQASPASDIAAARKKRRGLFLVAGIVVVVVAAGLGVHFATAGGTTAKSTAATVVPSVHASTPAAKPSASGAAQASASASAKASAAASAKAATGTPPVTSLPVASAMAFGPNGLADGDDPADAANVIAANPSQPWSTQWYTTATFGMLKHGTGLVLDMGSAVTVTTVQIDLSQYQGANLQVRVGNDETLADLQVAATADNVSGTVNLTLSHPVAARYLLIWITQLPLGSGGHYQETISHVAVTGYR